MANVASKYGKKVQKQKQRQRRLELKRPTIRNAT